MHDRDGWIWHDGALVPWRSATTHVLTHSLHYGLAVFEGLRAYDTADGPAIFRVEDHTVRLVTGDTLRPGGVYDSNGAIVAAAVTEAGGEPVPFGAFPDDAATLEQAVRRALAECDMVVLSGGTSKGAGDLSHRVVSQLGMDVDANEEYHPGTGPAGDVPKDYAQMLPRILAQLERQGRGNGDNILQPKITTPVGGQPSDARTR